MVANWLSPLNKLGKIMDLYCWTEEDFVQEFLIHLLNHNRESTIRWRETWLLDGIDLDNIETDKRLRAWTKFELKAFIGRTYYRGIQRLKDSQDDILDEPIVAEGEDDMLNKIERIRREKCLVQYIEEDLTEEESFILFYKLGQINLEINSRRIMNYPGGSISEKTFYSRVDKFFKKLSQKLS